MLFAASKIARHHESATSSQTQNNPSSTVLQRNTVPAIENIMAQPRKPCGCRAIKCARRHRYYDLLQNALQRSRSENEHLHHRTVCPRNANPHQSQSRGHRPYIRWVPADAAVFPTSPILTGRYTAYPTANVGRLRGKTIPAALCARARPPVPPAY